MSRIPALPRIALSALAVAALASAPSLAQIAPEHRSIRSVSAEGDTLVARFAPNDFVSGTLAVSGKGVSLANDFSAHELGSVRLVDADGAPLADGSYTWELRLLVSAPTEEEPEKLAMRTSSGTFRLQGGFLQLPAEIVDSASPADQPVNQPGLQTIASADIASGDDYIVNPTDNGGVADDGGLCVGFDCVDPTTFPNVASTDDESWIYMQGEQTGLRFDDTGGAGASTDWQILANGPDAGGADELTFDDLSNTRTPLTLSASAGQDSLFVAPQNSTPADRGAARIGIGTSTPEDDVNVTIQGGSSDASMVFRSGANAEWIVSAAPASFAIIDNTGGADDILFDLSAAAAGDSFVVGDADGQGRARVGIGTATPDGGLHISGTATQDLFSGMGPDLINGPAFNYGYAGQSIARSAGFFNVRPDALAAAPNPSLRFMTGNQQRMIIDNQGFVGFLGTSGVVFDPIHPLQMSSGAHVTAGGVWTNSSSRSLKNSIETLSPLVAMVAFEQLEPVRYRYDADPGDEHLGFIAEDVPGLVATPDRKGLAPMDLVSLLTKVVQVQQDKLESQTETIESLLKRVEALEAGAQQ